MEGPAASPERSRHPGTSWHLSQGPRFSQWRARCPAALQRALAPADISKATMPWWQLRSGRALTALPAGPLRSCLPPASSINLPLNRRVSLVQNNLLFQEEIAFLAPRNLFAVFVGSFKRTLVYY